MPKGTSGHGARLVCVALALVACGSAHAAPSVHPDHAAPLREVSTSGDWHLSCPEGVRDAHLAGCVAAIRVRSGDDPAQWVRMAFSFPRPGAYPTIDILVPSSAMRHDGISLGMDGRQVGTVPMGPCDASGCPAHVEVDARLLGELDARDIEVEYQVDKDGGLRHSLPAAGLGEFIRLSGVGTASRRRDE